MIEHKSTTVENEAQEPIRALRERVELRNEDKPRTTWTQRELWAKQREERQARLEAKSS